MVCSNIVHKHAIITGLPPRQCSVGNLSQPPLTYNNNHDSIDSIDTKQDNCLLTVPKYVPRALSDITDVSERSACFEIGDGSDEVHSRRSSIRRRSEDAKSNR